MFTGDDPAVSFHVKWQRSHALLSFDIRGGQLLPADLAAVRLPLKPDESVGVVISGRGPTWLYAHLSYQLRRCAWVAVTDANMNRAVVVRSLTAEHPQVGEILVGPGFSSSEPGGAGGFQPGVALALLGNPHRGKSVLAAALYEVLRMYRDNEWYVLRARADGEGQWSGWADGGLVRVLREKRVWTKVGALRMAEEIRVMRSSRRLTVVDLPGVTDEITAELLRHCSHSLILVDVGDSALDEARPWKEMCQASKVMIMGVLQTTMADAPSPTFASSCVDGTIGGLGRHGPLPVPAARVVLDSCLARLGIQLADR